MCIINQSQVSCINIPISKITRDTFSVEPQRKSKRAERYIAEGIFIQAINKDANIE